MTRTVMLNEFTELEREYMDKMGYMPALPFEVESAEWLNHFVQAKAQHPEETNGQHRARALARLAWLKRPKDTPPNEAPAMAPGENVTHPVAGLEVDSDEYVTYLRDLARIGQEILYLFRGFAGVSLFVAVVLLALGVQSHCQVDGLRVQESGVAVGNPCMGGICGLNFAGSGCSVSKSGQVWTITCTSGSVTNNPSGSTGDLQTKNGANFGAVASTTTTGVTAGKVLISQPAGAPPAFADPLVQGTKAEGAAIDNPVTIGGKDGSGNSLAFAVDASGRPTVNVNGTVPVSGTFWQATQPVSLASVPSHAVTNAGTFPVQVNDGAGHSMPAGDASARSIHTTVDNASITVTGTFWQATQPVSGTFWQATQPVSLASVPSHEVNNVATATTTNAAGECAIVSAASTNSTSCKASAGNLYGFELFNTTTTVYYLRLYNSSGAPTCSSATGFIRSIPIPPAAAAGQVGGAVSNFVVPVGYGTGIGYCITGGSSSTDNTNAAVGVFGALRYK